MKNEIRHTPGPWAVGGKLSDSVFAGKLLIADVYEGMIGAPDKKANARLIAAAPELFSFIQELVDGAESEKPSPDNLLERAKALIAKATGAK